MKSREQLSEFFECDETTLESLLGVQAAGERHGRVGFYPDGDFSSDADWCYGVGAEITRLENSLGCDSGEVFDLYCAAHSEGFVRGRDCDCGSCHDHTADEAS